MALPGMMVAVAAPEIHETKITRIKAAAKSKTNSSGDETVTATVFF